MRGSDDQQSSMFSYLSPEARVRVDHPLRAIRRMVDEVLRSLSPEFNRMYSREGRPSIAPEKLLRALLLQLLYSVRSERLLMEEIDYSILFRWFVGLNLDERGVGRDDLHQEPGSVAGSRCCQAVSVPGGGAGASEGVDLGRALHRGRHADGSMGECEELPAQGRASRLLPEDDPGNPTVDFHGERRSNQRHQSKTDSEAMLARKGAGKEAKLSYSGNLLVENRNGLIVNAMVWEATGTAERDTALLMLEQIPGEGRITVGGDKGFDTKPTLSPSAAT